MTLFLDYLNCLLQRLRNTSSQDILGTRRLFLKKAPHRNSHVYTSIIVYWIIWWQYIIFTTVPMYFSTQLKIRESNRFTQVLCFHFSMMTLCVLGCRGGGRGVRFRVHDEYSVYEYMGPHSQLIAEWQQYTSSLSVSFYTHCTVCTVHVLFSAGVRYHWSIVAVDCGWWGGYSTHAGSGRGGGACVEGCRVRAPAGTLWNS